MKKEIMNRIKKYKQVTNLILLWKKNKKIISFLLLMVIGYIFSFVLVHDVLEHFERYARALDVLKKKKALLEKQLLERKTIKMHTDNEKLTHDFGRGIREMDVILYNQPQPKLINESYIQQAMALFKKIEETMEAAQLQDELIFEMCRLCWGLF